MLKIHSFLHGIKSMIKKTVLDSYKSCIMITAYTMVAIIIILSSDNLYGKGNNIVEAYAKVDSEINTFSPVEEETAKTAQIQAEELNLNAQAEEKFLNNDTNILNSGSNKGINILASSNLDMIRADMKEDMVVQTKAIVQASVDAREKAEAEQKALKEKEEAEKKEKEKKEKEKKEKEQKEKAAKAAKEAAKAANVIKISDSDKKILQRIVEAEATGEDIKGKMLVASVILNRVASDKFPNTVEKVVFQKNGNTVQFSPTKDGRYWSVTISKETIKAVDRVLAGEDYSQGALFFSARSAADKSSMSWFDRNLKWLFKYGGHEFYTTK